VSKETYVYGQKRPIEETYSICAHVSVKRDLCIWQKGGLHISTSNKQDLLQALGRAHALFIFIYFHLSFYFFSSKTPVAGVGACARIIHFHLFLLIFLFFFFKKISSKRPVAGVGARACLD